MKPEAVSKLTVTEVRANEYETQILNNVDPVRGALCYSPSAAGDDAVLAFETAHVE
jgi:hypothetical protein